MIYLGADPEFFIMKNKKAAIAEDFWQQGSPKGYFGDALIERDGLVAEIKNPNPNSCRDSFNDTIGNRAEELAFAADRMGYSIKASAWEEFDSAEIDIAPENAKVFGCRVDFNAYTLQPNQPKCPPELLGRPAGGHLHFGYDGDAAMEELRDAAPLIIGFDYTIGLLSIALTPDEKDKELERKKYYGQAGAFRLIDRYHVEYRTPSSAAFNLMPWVNTYQGLGKMMMIHFAQDYWQHVFKSIRSVADPREVVRIINEHDSQAAKQVLKNVLTTIATFESDVWDREGRTYFADIDSNNYDSYRNQAFDYGYANNVRYMDYLPSTAAYLDDISSLFVKAVDMGYRPGDFELPYGWGMHSTAHGAGGTSLARFLKKEEIAFNGRDEYYGDEDDYYDDNEPCNCSYCR